MQLRLFPSRWGASDGSPPSFEKSLNNQVHLRSPVTDVPNHFCLPAFVPKLSTNLQLLHYYQCFDSTFGKFYASLNRYSNSCHFDAVYALKPPYYSTCMDLKGGGGGIFKREGSPTLVSKLVSSSVVTVDSEGVCTANADSPLSWTDKLMDIPDRLPM